MIKFGTSGLPFTSGGGEESGGATEGATEGVMEGATEGATEGVMEGATEGATEGRSRRGHPRPRTEVILVLTFQNILPNGLADPLGMEKLEL